MGKGERLELLAVAALYLAFSGLLAQVDSDPDIWGRLAYARDAAAQHVSFQAEDPYSYTARSAHSTVAHRGSKRSRRSAVQPPPRKKAQASQQKPHS